MKSHRIPIIAALSAFGCTITLGSSEPRGRSSADPVTATASGTEAQIEIATEAIENQSAAELKGKKVIGADNVELGKIKDFIIDTQTGRIVYAVVSSGGAFGLGDKLRLVQQSSLRASPTGETFSAQLDDATFKALPVVSVDELKSDRIAAVQPESEAQADSTAMAPERDAATAPITVTAGAATDDKSATKASDAPSQHATHLVLASELKGKPVRAGDRNAGEIQAVALDVQQGTAAALVKTDEQFAGTESKFKVPFVHLQFRDTKTDQVVTTLSPADFANVPPASRPDGATFAASKAATTPATSDSPGDDMTSEPRTPTTRTDLAANDRNASQPVTNGNQNLGGPPLAARDTALSSALEQPSTTDDPSTTAAATDVPAINDNTTSTVAGGPNGEDINGARGDALTPTGHGGAEAHAALAAAASAIRAAFSNDAELADQRIEVARAGTKIRLKGKVETENAKRRAEAIARVAANGAEIENRIRVTRR